MNAIAVQSTTIVGPYKNYLGRAEYDSEARMFQGEIVGTRDVVTFAGQNLQDLGKAFQESVDDYLAFCASSGHAPERPFSGKFVTRVSPDIHKRLSDLAAAAGLSLNQFICNYLEKMVIASSEPSSKAKPRSKPTRLGRPAIGAAKKRAQRSRSHS
jgi:predicted HicB family RNase H-like nuclease